MIPRRICVFVGSRANYASIKSALKAINEHPDLELQLVAGASALLDRYGSVIEVMDRDGFESVARVYMLLEGETPTTMAKSTGLGLIDLATTIDNLQPDVVLTVGDRFETMATTLAASYMNVPLAHTMGGEVSGSIDDRIRHAVTKFADIHFPACEDARERIIRMGEEPDCVHNVGCPRIDLVAEILQERPQPEAGIFTEGVGPDFNLDEPFLLLSQHPVTTEYGDGERQINETLQAVLLTGMPTLALWPNADAGADDIARGMRKFRERYPDAPVHFFKNLPPEVYVPLMKTASCMIGNSSSAIREGAFIGTPSVNIGTRQFHRQRGANIIEVGHDRNEIFAAIQDRIAHGPFPSEPIYGEGKAGEKIAEILATSELDTRKVITY